MIIRSRTPNKRWKMPELFTTFARSRYVHASAVVKALRERAAQFLSQHSSVQRIFLVGSFASRQATPRSDIDLILEVSLQMSKEERSILWDQAYDWFTFLPFGVDLFVLDSDQLQADGGLAEVVRREGLCLATGVVDCALCNNDER